jgi:hypothetical protein
MLVARIPSINRGIQRQSDTRQAPWKFTAVGWELRRRDTSFLRNKNKPRGSPEVVTLLFPPAQGQQQWYKNIQRQVDPMNGSCLHPPAILHTFPVSCSPHSYVGNALRLWPWGEGLGVLRRAKGRLCYAIMPTLHPFKYTGKSDSKYHAYRLRKPVRLFGPKSKCRAAVRDDPLRTRM